ncbi:MAG: hypothetical protein JAY88_13265, partial [Candidatus Thiodiazotropha lotti]|nr:hypothetical protein [Candidatus Thiodiazotropha lotti]MCW4188032.1 hypothetical protein [Candidatus Thiodiazotropha lotti]
LQPTAKPGRPSNPFFMAERALKKYSVANKRQSPQIHENLPMMKPWQFSDLSETIDPQRPLGNICDH